MPPTQDGINWNRAVRLTPKRKKKKQSGINATTASSKNNTSRDNASITPTEAPSSPTKQAKFREVHMAFNAALDLLIGDNLDDHRSCVKAYLEHLNNLSDAVSSTPVNNERPHEKESEETETVAITPIRPTVLSRKLLKVASNPSEIEYDPHAFGIKVNKRTGAVSPRNDVSAQQAKKRAIEQINLALSKIGTAEQKLLLSVIDSRQMQPLISSVAKSDRELDVNVIGNLKEVLSVAQKHHRTNDSKTFQRTVLMAIAPNENNNQKAMTKLANRLGFKA